MAVNPLAEPSSVQTADLEITGRVYGGGQGRTGASPSISQPVEPRPRIVYLIGQLGIGGYEQQLYYLLQTIDRLRYRPMVVVWGATRAKSYETRIQALGIPLRVLPQHLGKPAKLIALRRLVRDLSPEVVHSYSFYTNFPAWYATAGTDIVAIGSIRNNFTSEIRAAGGILGRLSARWPSFQIANSAAAGHVVEQVSGLFRPARVHVVPNGIDVHPIPPSSPLPAEPRLLAVGRLYHQKRWDRLINVMSLLQRAGLSFSVRHAGEGPLRQSLEAQARRLGVDHRLSFLGERHDIPLLLAGSTLLVHTADEEGCPNVVMEAMASARAVVATDAGHVPHLIDDGTTGYVVTRGDDTTFAERVATLLANPNVASRMGLAGRRRAECEFGLQQLLDRTLQAYCAAGWRD